MYTMIFIFAIQLVRVLLLSLVDVAQVETEHVFNLQGVTNIVACMHQMLNVIIRSIHFYFFCLLTLSWLGHRTNSNFSAGLNEIVLRRRRVLQGSCQKS
jgi:hypothetical protein